ncbi:hypothetical protein V7S43_010052 [Phytophthora oleae]|uniref:PDZ domain-containing protein n=1 Tax=Phytophthora oleae TaxID=2107226 RepID=A0ABD3FEZ5_9STRA
MAHDGSSDDESTYLDAQDITEEDVMPPESKVQLEVELSPSSSPLKPGSPSPSSRPKAVSAAAAPISVQVNGQDTNGSNETLRAVWDDRRRTQSDGNLRVEGSSSGTAIAVNSTAPAGFLASPAQSESALMHKAPPPPPISVRPAVDTKPNGFMAMGENFLTGMADFARIKSPRGNMQKVHVVYPTPGPLFVDLYSREDGTGARVKGFRRKPDGSMADTEASGRVYPGDFLVSINAVDVTKLVFGDIITAAKEATFPLTLTFHCYQVHKEEHEKLIQQKPMSSLERNTSSGPLPPASPSSAGWGARLSQMTRSGSFDQKLSGSGSDLTNGPPKSPSSPSTNSDTSGGKFGFSLGKVGTDGVKKNLFRMMGNKPSRPEEDKNMVKTWMNDLALKPHNNSSGGRHRKTQANTNAAVLHSTPIVAVTTGGRFVGVLDEDVNEFALTWFRKTPPEMDIQQIKGVKRCPYFPSVDDVGAILSLQCESLRFPQLKRVAEMPTPLVLDPAVGNTVDVFLEAGAGSFSATLASNEHDSFQVKISSEAVTLVKISEEEGGVVVKAEYTTFLQVLLDPADQLRFTLKVQEFGGFLGNRDGDTCDLKKRQQQLEKLSCFFLVAQNRQNRDILTLLIRNFRARVLTPEQEELARADEKNLFVDPAFVVAVAPPPPLTASKSVGSSSGAISPASNSAATGESASSVGSPTSVSTPHSGATSSPGVGKNRLARLQSEGSFGSASGARLSDLVGLEPDDAGDPAKERGSDMTTPAMTPPRSALTPSKNGFTVNNSDGDNAFAEGRLAAQDKEIAMFREKLASVSVLLKTSEQENKQLKSSLEVKDNRIELQQMKIHQLEKFHGQSDSQAREIQALRAKLEDEERRHTLCKEELQQLTSAAAKRASEVQDQGAQTEVEFLGGEGLAVTVNSGSGWERDAWSGTVATVSASDLQQQIKDQQTQIARLHDDQVNLIAERNMFRSKSMELSRELRKLVGANNNQPLDNLEMRLAERTSLQAELASVKADAKCKGDELAKLRSLLDSGGDKDKGTKRLAAQNAELQRTIYQLQDSLSESRDQVDAVKKINSALASRLHRLQPETRGSILEHPPISPSSNLPALSSDEEDDDDDDEEEDEELKDGIAAFRRSLVGQ